MFNSDQRSYMAHLESLPREARCDCGWSRRGECDLSCYGDQAKGGKTKVTPEKT